MDNNLQTIGISQILATLPPDIVEHSIGTDFILGEISGRQVGSNRPVLDMLQYPVRFDGFILFFLKKGGRFRLDFNLNSFEIRERSLLLTAPGNIVRLSAFDEERIADCELVFVLMSKDFVTNIHVDFDQPFQDAVHFFQNPCIVLSDEQLDLATDYFTLACKIVRSSLDNKREIISSLLTSITYMAVNIWRSHVQTENRRQDAPSQRVNQMYERFITLVSEYHNRERGMAFYADKMCITPKYLSKIVKQASGRSGPDWIDSFVILEAKNLLKYTSKPIKEIVWQLHFPNPSVFNKFFRKHTGLTPSAYRKEKMFS